MNLTSKRFKNANAFAFVETLIEVCRSADQMLKEVQKTYFKTNIAILCTE